MFGLFKKIAEEEIELDDALLIIRSLSNKTPIDMSHRRGKNSSYYRSQYHPNTLLSFLKEEIKRGRAYPTSVKCRIFEGKKDKKYVLIFQNRESFINVFGERVERELLKAKVTYNQRKGAGIDLTSEASHFQKPSDNYKYGFHSSYFGDSRVFLK